jgi:hypothetical protein
MMHGMYVKKMMKIILVEGIPLCEKYNIKRK